MVPGLRFKFPNTILGKRAKKDLVEKMGYCLSKPKTLMIPKKSIG